MRTEEMVIMAMIFFITMIFTSMFITFKTADYDDGFQNGLKVNELQIEKLQTKVNQLELEKNNSFAGSIGYGLSFISIAVIGLAIGIIIVKYLPSPEQGGKKR